jgi:hypothetical protein
MSLQPETLKLGDEFFHITPDEFTSINKRAQAVGLIPLVFEIERDDDDNCVSVSFELERE